MPISIFLSSTAKDLEEYREAAQHAVEGLDGYRCVRMENFGARAWNALDFCRTKVGECDLFIGIVGHLHGSSPPGSQSSYTELEYEAAIDYEKPRLMFLASDGLEVPMDLIDQEFEKDPNKRIRQKAFYRRVAEDRICGIFDSPEELSSLIQQAIHNWKQPLRDSEKVEPNRGYLAPYTCDRTHHALFNDSRTPANQPLQVNPAAQPLAETITDSIGSTMAPSRTSWFNFSLNTSRQKVAISFVLAAVFLTATFGVFTFSSLKSRNVTSAPPVGVKPPSNINSTANANHVPDGRSLSYWLTVQKMRDGKPYQEPFKSSGQEIFETGYRFRLNVSSPQAGYLYLLNEGASAGGVMNFTFIYPTPVRNNGSAAVQAWQSIETGWNVFSGQPGTEQFWIVWSTSTIQELEAAREAAFQTDDGSLTNPAVVRDVREFLMKNETHNSEVIKNTAQRETVVKGQIDPLVKLLELEHR